jgi:hypothetical protein
MCTYPETMCNADYSIMLTGATSCTGCPDGTYLTGHHCGDCLEGYWANDATNTCDDCDTSCKCCAGGADD